MKTNQLNPLKPIRIKKSKAILILSILIFSFLSCTCEDKKRTEFIEFLTTSNDMSEFIEEQNLVVYNPIDATNPNRIQAMHIDLENQFAILGKVEVTRTTNQLNNLELKLKEIDSKNRYDMKKVYYRPPATIDDGIKTHHLVVEIVKGHTAETYHTLELNGLKELKEGEIIDIHIESNACEINTVENNTCQGNVRATTNFGDNFCKGIVLKSFE